nr:MAG TPA: hypothetical protein [Caudoviricetes sp.]
MNYEEKLKKTLSTLSPEVRLALAQQWSDLAIALCRIKKMAASEMRLMGVSPKGIDAEVFLCVTAAQQAEEIILMRSRCAALMPDVEKILQYNLDGVHQHEIESVSVWDVPEFSHVDGWGPDWLAASGLDEAVYQIRHLLYAEHCTDGCACEMVSERYLSPQSLCELILTLYRRYEPPMDVCPHAAMIPGYLYCMMDRSEAVRLVEATSLADTRRRAELAMDGRYRERGVCYMGMVSEDLPERALYGRRSHVPLP